MKRMFFFKKQRARESSKQLRDFISALPNKGVKDVFSFRMSPRETQHRVAGNILPVNYGLIDPRIGYGLDNRSTVFRFSVFIA
jgi:hypothetical protein